MPVHKRLESYGAKNRAGVFNRYYQLLSSLKSINELTASDFIFHFKAVVLKVSSFLVVVAEVQQFLEAGGAKIRIHVDSSTGFKS